MWKWYFVLVSVSVNVVVVSFTILLCQITLSHYPHTSQGPRVKLMNAISNISKCLFICTVVAVNNYIHVASLSYTLLSSLPLKCCLGETTFEVMTDTCM